MASTDDSPALRSEVLRLAEQAFLDARIPLTDWVRPGRFLVHESSLWISLRGSVAYKTRSNSGSRPGTAGPDGNPISTTDIYWYNVTRLGAAAAARKLVDDAKLLIQGWPRGHPAGEFVTV